MIIRSKDGRPKTGDWRRETGVSTKILVLFAVKLSRRLQKKQTNDKTRNIARTDIEHRLGGAANVARNVKALGAKPILCSVIGNDEKGKILLQIMKSRGMDTTGIVETDSRITTTKTRIISDNQHLLRVDEEYNKAIPENLEITLINRIKKIIETTKIDSIIFQDYDKGVITKSLIKTIVEIANKHQIPTLVLTKKTRKPYTKRRKFSEKNTI